MRILHLFSDTKLTGPAEPALNLCSELKRQGFDVLFACCSSARSSTVAVEKRARELGLEPITSFRLKKHFALKENLQDLLEMPQFLREQRVELVHAHLDNDHLVGAQSARNAKAGILVLRSCYKGRGPRRTVRNRYIFGRMTDGVVVASEIARLALQEKFKFPQDRVWILDGAIDTQRFSPASVKTDVRPGLSLAPDDFVVGIVARIQTHRRFEVLLEAMKMVSQRRRGIKLLIVGRGTKMQSIAVEPVSRMGLTDCVRFAGYQTGSEYVDTLACMDVKLFLVPGTDGTCRAVREAMAMGKPIIAARRGMLPELVEHGRDGLVIDDTPAGLAGAILYLAERRNRADAMGKEALKKATKRFRLSDQASQMASVYERLFEMGRRRLNE